MLKWYMKGDPPAVFPKNRSVLLLAAVVLLLCCCLFVPAAAAESTGTQDDPIVVPEHGYDFSSGSITGINPAWLSTLPDGGENVWLKLEIPDKINGEEVESIGSSAFKKASADRYKIASVDMSEASSLVSIGNDAFWGNSQITSLTLPDSLTSIGTYAFYQCTGITSLTLPDSLTKIGENAFRDCSGITGEITIPAGIKNLENNVFSGCSKLTGVYLPSQLTTIGESVFAGCSGLKFIRVAGQDAPAGNFILPSGLTRMGSQAFMGCSGIVGEVTIPEGVTTLEKSVFNGCSGLTGVYLSTGLKQIGTSDGGSVFYGCTGLQFIRVNGDKSDDNFTLPDTLTTIGKHSFYKCFADSVSTSVRIPKSVDYIGSEAFHHSNAITTIFIERELDNAWDDGYDNYDTYAFKASNYGPGKRLTIFPDSMYGWKDFPLTGDYGDSLTYPLTLKFSGAGKYNHLILYNQPIYYAYNEMTGEWEFDMKYELPPVPDQGDTPRLGHTYGWACGSGATAELLHINWKYTGGRNPSVKVDPKDVLAPPTIQPSIDGVALSQSGPSFHLTVSGGQDVGVSVTHPLAGEGDNEGYVYFKYEWTDVQDSTDGPRMSAEKDLFGKEQDEPSIPIRDSDDARYETGDFYYVEVYAYYYDRSTRESTLYYKSHDAVIYFGSDQDTKATVSTVYCLYVTVADPVVIEPVNLTIYANEKFPSPLYSGIPENAVIEVNDAEWEDDTYPYPFEIAYYNTTTNTPISKPDTPGIYNATIQPVQEGVQLAQITIDDNPVTFRNGTLTVRQITDASETIPVKQQTLQNDGISVSVPEDTIYYLNDNISLPEVSAGKIHLLHDEILAGGEDTLKQIAPEYFDDSSKYEMKYFDLIDTGNGHTWVSSLKDVTITWPYPEGTDESTEFTLLHYLDLHREYFTDADLDSKTETVTVSKTGSGVQFSIQQSGFSPFALIWSDQKPVPTPPSGGGSSDGNMDNAFRVLFNDGTTTLFVVTDLSYGDKLTKPEDPVKDGYTFAGWHKDAACTQAWDFADGIAGDMTLYAKWTPVQTVTPTATPTATASVTPTVTAEPTGLPTTTPTVQPTGEDDGGKPAGSVLPLIGGILILILAVLLLLFLLLRHTVTFLIPTGGEITEHRIKVWHGRYIDPADLPELLRTAAWYRDPARRERWDFNEDRVTKSMELYLG